MLKWVNILLIILKVTKDFAKKAKPGDIVIVGKNFGCGSSRQQAVDCFKALGINVIIAESLWCNL